MPLKEVLRDHAFSRFGKRRANLILLAAGKDIDNAIDRFRCTRRM